jgi:hypothetical protein
MDAKQAPTEIDVLNRVIDQWNVARDDWKAYREILCGAIADVEGVLARASGDFAAATVPHLGAMRTVKELRAYHDERLAELAAHYVKGDELEAALDLIRAAVERISAKYGVHPAAPA